MYRSKLVFLPSQLGLKTWWKGFVQLVEGVQTNCHTLASSINRCTKFFWGFNRVPLRSLNSLIPENRKRFLRTHTTTITTKTTVIITTSSHTVLITLAKIGKSSWVQTLYIGFVGAYAIPPGCSRLLRRPTFSRSMIQIHWFKMATENGLVSGQVRLGLHEVHLLGVRSRRSSTISRTLRITVPVSNLATFGAF